MYTNKAAYIKSPWQFEIRDNPVHDPGPGQLLLEIAACGICGTDLHTADRLAQDWQPFGHEIIGVVRKVGEGVTRFKPGARVALDTAVPCGNCDTCLPAPYGLGRSHLCPTPLTYCPGPFMGFAEFMLTPQECAQPVPDCLSTEAASLVEPLGVSLDLVETAEIKPGDHVLVIGPGPLGLGAVALAKRSGAARVVLAGLSKSASRMESGLALGADELIEVDKVRLSDYNFGSRRPDKILVTAPPSVLPEAITVAATGAVIAYIGIAFGPASVIQFDADNFHFRKLSLRGSFGSPAIHTAESIQLLCTMPELAKELISHRFALESIGEAMEMIRNDDERTVKKVVMINPKYSSS